jgi:hypothetical protein
MSQLRLFWQRQGTVPTGAKAFGRLVVGALVAGAVSVLVAGALATDASGGRQFPSTVSGSCRPGSKPAVIAGNFKCLRAGQRCSLRYQRAYRRYGFHCVSGRLRKGTGVRVTPPPNAPAPSPPPPPAPTPAAVDGHYKGLTSQNETFEFDVFSGGLAFRGLKTGQINEGCTPPGHIYGNYFDWPNYVVPVTVSGDFLIDTPLNGGTVGGWPASGRLTIRGHMAGQAGSGSLELSTTYTNGSNGVTYSCGSGLQTWTVTRIG